MKEPDLKTKLFGHPLAMIVMGGLCLIALYICSQDITAWPVAVPAVVGMGAVLKASEARSEYRAWRQAWDAMSGAKRPPTNWRAIGITAGIVAGVLLLGATPDETTGHMFVAAGLLVGAVAIIWSVATSASRGDAGSTDPVSISTPSEKAPSLRDAYSELPKHAWDTLGK